MDAVKTCRSCNKTQPLTHFLTLGSRNYANECANCRVIAGKMRVGIQKDTRITRKRCAACSELKPIGEFATSINNAHYAVVCNECAGITW